MASHHLAQINIAYLRASIDDPLIADFVADLKRINSLAEACKGFLWSLKDEAGDATTFNPYNDPSYSINMSVWQDVPSLNRKLKRSFYF